VREVNHIPVALSSASNADVSFSALPKRLLAVNHQVGTIRTRARLAQLVPVEHFLTARSQAETDIGRFHVLKAFLPP
jgi:hypothetical protein